MKSQHAVLSEDLSTSSSVLSQPSSFSVHGLDGKCKDIDVSSMYLGKVVTPSHFKLDATNEKLYYHDICMPRCTYDGEIQVILGCMYSGKTSELQRRGRRMAIAQKSVLYIKLDKDMRYEREKVVTHDGIMEDALVCGVLKDSVEEALKHDVICIDEGQFFPNLLEYCDLMANIGKRVIVAMLHATYNRSAFPSGNTLEIVAIARNVDQLTSVCQNCGVDGASISSLISKADVMKVDSNGKFIGGNDVYSALCRRCHFANLSK